MSILGPMADAIKEIEPAVEAAKSAGDSSQERFTNEERSSHHTEIAHHWKMKKTTMVEADFVTKKDNTKNSMDEEGSSSSNDRWCSCFGLFKTKR